MSKAWSGGDPRDERINIPGTDNAWNWGYRLPGKLELLLADDELASSSRALASVRKARP